MKMKLTVLALSLACSSCAVAPMMISGAVSKMDFNDVQNLVSKVSKAADGQREISMEEEVALGGGMASDLLGAAPLLQDKKLQRYVNQVGMWLAAQTERSDLPWRFAVLDDNEFNAFSTPGGYVFITRGLLLSLRNESELAGVLAHEIAHVVKQHHLAALRANAGKNALADFASSIVDKSPSTTRVAGLTPAQLKIAAGLFTDVFFRGLNKDDEFEADRIAVVICARAGYDPYGLPAVLQSMGAINPGYQGASLILRTHPSFAARLDNLTLVMNDAFDKFEGQPNMAARFRQNVPAPKLAGR